MSDSGKTFEGKVDSIGYGVLPDDGGPVLGGLPKVSRSINWVRVAQRFPVKIMVDKPDRKCSASALRQSLILSRNNERAQLPAITGGQAAGVLS